MQNKKIYVGAVIGIFFFAACSKDIQKDPVPSRNIKKSGEIERLPEYDYFETPKNAEEIFQAFIEGEYEYENEQVGINEAVWLLEGAINYNFRHKLYAFESLNVVQYSFNLDVDEENISTKDINQLYNNIKNEIEGNLDGEDKAFHVSDVYVKEILGNIVKIGMDVIYAEAIVFSPPVLKENANSDRDHFEQVHCDESTAPNTGFDYTEKLTYNKILNNTWVSWQYYHYGVNVVGYRDNSFCGPTPCSIPAIDGSELYYQVNDAIFPSNGLIVDKDCVDKDEINTYRDKAYDACTALLDPNTHVFLLDIEWNVLVVPGARIFWIFDEVKIGEVRYHPPATPDPKL